jgi:3D (Asp-Asp-Asp) domain-containing protein
MTNRRSMPITAQRTAQRVSRGLLVGLCAAMAIGMIGAVTVRATDQTSENLVTTESAAPTELLSSYSIVATPMTVSVSRSKVRTLKMEVTGYCPCKKCCGENAKGITASGKKVSYNGGKFVAADTKVLPFGTKLSIPGYHDGKSVEVIDRGGAIKGNKLDLYFPTHQAALEWGRKVVTVKVVGE